MSAGMGLLYSLFASLILVWPSERARRLAEFGHGGLAAASAALAGWVVSSLALVALPLAGGFGLLAFWPDLLALWRWAGIAVLFWLASAGQLAPSMAYRPFAANDNAPVKGLWRVVVSSAARSYSWRTALVVAALVPQFLNAGLPVLPQILFAASLYAGIALLAAAFYGLFPRKAHAFLNLIPERRKALKTGLNGYRQHGQTRISYGRKAA